MGRSVSVASNSVHVSYQTLSYDRFYCSECGESFNEVGFQDGEDCCPNCASREFYKEDGCQVFDDALSNLKESLKNAFPSLVSDDKWLDREDHAILSNSFAYFGVSEYCGLVSIWVTPTDGENPSLAGRWIDQIEEKFLKTIDGAFGVNLRKTGTFSNGESVFSAVR
jgi:DNA-directed RNA polymerase subunit RPC12/RpoP